MEESIRMYMENLLLKYYLKVKKKEFFRTQEAILGIPNLNAVVKQTYYPEEKLVLTKENKHLLLTDDGIKDAYMTLVIHILDDYSNDFALPYIIEYSYFNLYGDEHKKLIKFLERKKYKNIKKRFVEDEEFGMTLVANYFAYLFNKPSKDDLQLNRLEKDHKFDIMSRWLRERQMENGKLLVELLRNIMMDINFYFYNAGINEQKVSYQNIDVVLFGTANSRVVYETFGVGKLSLFYRELFARLILEDALLYLEYELKEIEEAEEELDEDVEEDVYGSTMIYEGKEGHWELIDFVEDALYSDSFLDALWEDTELRYMIYETVLDHYNDLEYDNNEAMGMLLEPREYTNKKDNK